MCDKNSTVLKLFKDHVQKELKAENGSSNSASQDPGPQEAV